MKKLRSICLLMGPIIQGPMEGKAFFRSIEPNVLMSDEKLLGLDAIEEVVMYGYACELRDLSQNYSLANFEQEYVLPEGRKQEQLAASGETAKNEILEFAELEGLGI